MVGDVEEDACSKPIQRGVGPGRKDNILGDVVESGARDERGRDPLRDVFA